MSDKISELPVATTPLNLADLLVLVQGGVTKRSTFGDLPAGTTVISNANGVAIRFATGHQICYLETLQSFLAENPVVGTYTYEWTFPAAFTSAITYYVDARYTHANVLNAGRATVRGAARRESRTASACNIFTEVTTLTSASSRISCFAVGAWS